MIFAQMGNDPAKYVDALLADPVRKWAAEHAWNFVFPQSVERVGSLITQKSFTTRQLHYVIT